MGYRGVVVGDVGSAAKVVGVVVEDVGRSASLLQGGDIHGWRFNRDISRFNQFQQVGAGLFVSLHDAEAQPVIVVGGNGNRILSQAAGNSFAAVIVVLGVLPVLVEVDVGIRVEHRTLQLQVQRFRLAVHPLVLVEHGELVSPCVGSVVAIIGKVQAVVAVGLQVGCAVEQIVFRVAVRGLHLALAQRAVDAEGE